MIPKGEKSDTFTDLALVFLMGAPEGVMMFERPNWRDLSGYRALGDATRTRIAWEFLRRNSDYQKAWNTYAQKVRYIAAPDREVAAYVETFLDLQPTYTQIEEGSIESLNDLNAKLFEMGYFCAEDENPLNLSPLDQQLGKQWGLNTMLNPAVDGTGIFNLFIETVAIHSSGKSYFDLHDTKWLPITIDLSLPLQVIDAQMRIFVRQHRRLKQKRGVIHPINNRYLGNKKYIEYLRILDACCSGLNAKEIGEKLAPKQINHDEFRQRDKKYAAALKEALHLQSDGYRVLPLLGFGR